MAPNLAISQHEQIRDMICSKLTNATIARSVGCSTRSVQNIRSNLRCFGTTKALPNGTGRRRIITPPMLSALLERLIEKPGLCQDEMIIFLYDEFDTLVTAATISNVYPYVPGIPACRAKCEVLTLRSDIESMHTLIFL